VTGSAGHRREAAMANPISSRLNINVMWLLVLPVLVLLTWTAATLTMQSSSNTFRIKCVRPHDPLHAGLVPPGPRIISGTLQRARAHRVKFPSSH
jgi:hypothetical protein